MADFHSSVSLPEGMWLVFLPGLPRFGGLYALGILQFQSHQSVDFHIRPALVYAGALFNRISLSSTMIEYHLTHYNIEYDSI